jgi:hypothetical protein
MKLSKELLFLVGFVIALSSCKKDPKTRPVEFTETTYSNLGPYDNSGKPTDLLHDDISDALLAFIDATLPENQNAPTAHPEYFSSSAIADIAITQTSDVYVTFVRQGGSFNSALAFYTYPTTQPPVSAKDISHITYFFPKASGEHTTLASGDKVKLGQFTQGTSIGFVLMQNAFDTTNTTLNNNAVHFCTNDALNPEVAADKKKHAVIINYPPENKVLVGFEDMDRTLKNADDDFNDVVIYCTVVQP